jgi:hypothetical protein
MVTKVQTKKQPMAISSLVNFLLKEVLLRVVTVLAIFILAAPFEHYFQVFDQISGGIFYVIVVIIISEIVYSKIFKQCLKGGFVANILVFAVGLLIYGILFFLLNFI